MDSRGFAGHVLTVDLTDGVWETSPFDFDLASKLLLVVIFDFVFREFERYISKYLTLKGEKSGNSIII